MPKAMSENVLNHKVQVLRGLAIIAVVFIHNTPIGLAQVWCRPFMNFSVGLFIFLSGLLSSAKKWNPQKRIKKVVVPYVIWTLVYVVIANYSSFREIPYEFIRGLFTANSAAIMYYIWVYCEFTLLIPIIDRIAKSKYRWIGFIISPIEIITMRLIPLIMGYKNNKYVALIVSVSCVGWFTYFYLGYLLGNGLLEIKTSTRRLSILWIGAMCVQILEGYWYLSMGELNCGTQVKLSAILTGVVAVLIAYKYINADNVPTNKILKVLGDKSFGIYFSHLAVMSVLNKIPYYSKAAIYPLNAIITLGISAFCVIVGGKILGKTAKYFAL